MTRWDQARSYPEQVGTGESSICPPVEEGENPNGCPVDEAHSHLLTLWYYPEEVATLVEELGLAATGYHLLGHSWGTVVAALHAATLPYGLRSVVLAGGVANMTTYINAQWDPVEGNLGTLPPAMQDRLRQLEAAGDYADQVGPHYWGTIGPGVPQDGGSAHNTVHGADLPRA
jgi:pimeloyl-ACP methyl ester carboxylesterase